jgi:hypothetical protein
MVDTGRAGAADAPRGDRCWRDAEGTHIDVRGLEPPGPLVAILRLVDATVDEGPIIVHHDRDPRMLYPELAERGWVATALPAPPGEVRLKLERAS